MNYKNMYEPNVKARKKINQLKPKVFVLDHEVTSYQMTNISTNEKYSTKKGDTFTGRNAYYNLEVATFVPVSKNELVPAIKVDFGKTMHGFNGGFESQLYIDNKRICAVDTYHNCITIENRYQGKTVDLKFEIWTGFEGGGEPRELEHKLQYLEVGYEDQTLKSLLLLADAVTNMYELPDISVELKLKYRTIIEKFIYDIEKDVSHKQILKSLNEMINKLEKNDKTELLMFGHAHIDLAWLWTLKNGREKTIRTLSTVLKYCEQYDGFRFMHSSPQIFSYLKQNEQEMFEKIQHFVKIGKIEIEGAMWVEADNNLPSGESLCKQLLFGKKFIKNNFGHESSVLWIPDVFGYSWSMPQLLKKSNIDTFMTTKISWNKFNKMPTETFMWKGIDGSEILTHFMTTPEPNSQHWNKTYTAEINADLLSRTWTSYEDKIINDKLPVAYGYGDGGGGPSNEMIEQIDIYNKLPGIPQLKHTTLSEAAKIMHSSIDKENISVWDGELYLEYHRGTFTSQALIKKYNKQVERELIKLEQAAVMCGNIEIKEEIKLLWEEALLYQFHDIIPGSSLYEVNEEVKSAYRILLTKINKLKTLCYTTTDRLYAINHHINKTNNVYGEYISKNPNLKFKIDNKVLTSYYFDNKHVILFNEINSLSNNELETLVQAQEEKKVLASNELFITETYQIAFNDAGNICTLNDKNGKSVIGNYANKLVVYYDNPLNFDAWDFDIDYTENYQMPILSGQTIVTENNQLVTCIENNYTFEKSTIKELIVIEHKTGVINFCHEVTWDCDNKFLRSLTSSGVRSSNYKAGIQFGYIDRKNNKNTSWELAQYEVCAHDYIDISQYDRGMSIISNYKYGYNCEGDVVGISLLRSPRYPDHKADIGTHTYTYSLYPHQLNFDNSDVQLISYNKANKIDIVNSKLKMNNSIVSSLSIPDNLTISSLSYGYETDEIVIRLNEIKGGDANLSILDDSITIRELTIDEEAIRSIDSSVRELPFKPFEVKTLGLKGKNAIR